VGQQAQRAEEIARTLLEEPLPRRWAHTQGVAARARTLAPILEDEADLIESAAWLHDVGYSPALTATGFHPLDGARYLRDVQGADEVLCRLVANHSCAIIEARQRGLADDLGSEFPRVDPALEDALTYCDMTIAPDGLPVCVQNRLSEIVKRYGPFDLVTRFITMATPHLIASVGRVSGRLDTSIAPHVLHGSGLTIRRAL
jgi:HD domain